MTGSNMSFSVKDFKFYALTTLLWAGCLSDPDEVDKALKYLEVRRQHGGLLHRGRTTCLRPDSDL